MEINEQIKELVSQSVYDIVDKSTDIYVRLGKIQETMNRIEKAGADIKNISVPSNWHIDLIINNGVTLRIGRDDALSPLIFETVKQLITLLEAIHYSERKAEIINFNNSLKDLTNGKQAEE